MLTCHVGRRENIFSNASDIISRQLLRTPPTRRTPPAKTYPHPRALGTSTQVRAREPPACRAEPPVPKIEFKPTIRPVKSKSKIQFQHCSLPASGARRPQ